MSILAQTMYEPVLDVSTGKIVYLSGLARPNSLYEYCADFIIDDRIMQIENVETPEGEEPRFSCAMGHTAFLNTAVCCDRCELWMCCGCCVRFKQIEVTLPICSSFFSHSILREILTTFASFVEKRRSARAIPLCQ